MAGKLSKWLIGCGTAAAALILIFAFVAVRGFWFVRDTMRGFESAVETRQVLEDRFGDVGEFVPWPDGAVPAERMEVFLAVRQSLEPAQAKIGELFEALPTTEAEARELESQPFLKKLGSVFSITRSGFGLASNLGTFMEARNRALLGAGMGMGEYTYVYVLAYYSWLGHPTNEGPLPAPGQDINIELGDRDRDAVERQGLTSRVHGNLLEMMRAQLEALPESSPEFQPDAAEEWRQALGEELQSLENDDSRLPWQDGLPPPLLASLEPYRERLEAAYSPAANSFELTRSRKRGRWSIEAD